jgi:murein DD-endopeptidase MepM/ murein hydrolase activator NlpD
MISPGRAALDSCNQFNKATLTISLGMRIEWGHATAAAYYCSAHRLEGQVSFTISLPFAQSIIRATQLPGDHPYVNASTGVPDSTDHFGSSASAYDFALPIDTSVLAIGQGVVVASVNVVPDNQGSGTSWATSNPYGNFVTVRYDMGSGDFLYATYAHLKLNSGIPVNTVVSSGTTVGRVGLTGNTTGAHLHIQFGLTTATATSTGANPLKADAGGDYDLVTFGDPVGFQYVSNFNEYEYTFSSAPTLAGQIHAQAISLSNNTYSTTGTVGGGFETAVWNSDDYYSFVAPSGGTLSVHLSGLSNDLDLRLLDANGQRLNQSINNSTAAEDITQTVTAGSTYIIHIDPFHYDTSSYSLNVSFQPIQPRPVSHDFNNDGTSDILWRNGSNGDVGYWGINNNNATWHDFGFTNTVYSVVGVGDFNKDGTSDVLWRNGSNGDVGYWGINNNNATWHDFGLTNTAYSVVGVGDFNKDGTSDVLWRNGSNGDVGYWGINNNNATWHDFGFTDTAYSVVGVGDFNNDGTSDVLWRNGSNGDVGYWAINNNNEVWHDFGLTNTAYSVVGVGDFNKDGTSDVLWRNGSDGDIGYWGINNNSDTWHDFGLTNTAYSVVGVGDFNKDGTSDVLWRNGSSGDVGYWGINNNNATWHDFGFSNTAYNVQGV